MKGTPKKKKINSLKTGKRGELLVMAQMLAEGFKVYIPWVDDHGVDAVVRWKNGPFLNVQVKATGEGICYPASFSTKGLPNGSGKGFFVFHSEEWKTMWIMSRKEVRAHEKSGDMTFSVQSKKKNVENPDLAKFKAKNFDRLKKVKQKS